MNYTVTLSVVYRQLILYCDIVCCLLTAHTILWHCLLSKDSSYCTVALSVVYIQLILYCGIVCCL